MNTGKIKRPEVPERSSSTGGTSPGAKKPAVRPASEPDEDLEDTWVEDGDMVFIGRPPTAEHPTRSARIPGTRWPRSTEEDRTDPRIRQCFQQAVDRRLYEPSREPPTIVVDQEAQATPAAVSVTVTAPTIRPADRPVPVLLVVAGVEQGRRIRLIRDTMTLGRGTDNDLVVADLSCSRRHVVFKQRGTETVMSDLGSSNGTQVNAQFVRQATLRSGDRIELGNCILQFLHTQPADPVPAPRPVAAQKGWLQDFLFGNRLRSWITYIGGVLLGTLLLLILGELIAQRDTLPLPPDDLLAASRELIQQGRWPEAEARVAQVLESDPANRLALDYRATIQAELAARASLETARTLARQGDRKGALRLLDTIGADRSCHAEAVHLRSNLAPQ